MHFINEKRCGDARGQETADYATFKATVTGTAYRQAPDFGSNAGEMLSRNGSDKEAFITAATEDGEAYFAVTEEEAKNKHAAATGDAINEAASRRVTDGVAA